jgi:hypothetical protein
MGRVFRTLPIILLAWILLAPGHATAEGSSVTCQVALPPYVTCMYERTGWALWGLEGAYGVQVSLDFSKDDIAALSPYAVLGYYADDYAWWIEARIPGDIVPIIGSSDFVRAGVSFRW